VMYDAFGVRLHAGKQAKVCQAFYVAATDRQNNEVVTQIRKMVKRVPFSNHVNIFLSGK
jgi:acid phosphatase family membrane protein YuiD